jgi:hypothetical protein
VYVPAVRFIVIDLLPFANVGVAAMSGPLVPFWTLTLCGTADGLEKTIVTFPAFADSDIVLNINAPVEAAARCSVVALPLPAGIAAALLVELELIIEPDIVELLLDVGVAAEFEAAPPLAPAGTELELDELLPQAAIARAANGTASSESFLRMGPPVG